MEPFNGSTEESSNTGEMFAVDHPPDPRTNILPPREPVSEPYPAEPPSGPVTFVGPLPYPHVPLAPPPPPQRKTNKTNTRTLIGLSAVLVAVLAGCGLLGIVFYQALLPPHAAGVSFPTASSSTTDASPQPTGSTASAINTTPISNVTPMPTQPLPTRIPTQVPPTAAPGQPTPTPIPYANSARITFTRTTQAFSVPTQFTAAPSGGAISAQVVMASVSQYPSPAIAAAYMPGTGLTFTVTIHNHCACIERSLAGWQIHNIPNGLTCTLQGTVAMSPGMGSQQNCVVRPGRVGETQWDDATSHSPLEYVGANPSGGTDPFYSVPSSCATAGLAAAETAAQANLAQQLANKASGTIFTGPTYNYANTTCNPVAGTSQATAFTYVVQIDGSGQEATFQPGDAINYQRQQIAAHMASLGSSWYVASTSVCMTPTATATSTTTATITCAASGVAAWNWSASYMSSVAQLLVGETKANAYATLRATPGVAGNIVVQLFGGTLLPQNPAQIHLLPM